MKKVSIIGFGRFGKTLYRLLKDDFSITIYNRSSLDLSSVDRNITIAKTISKIYESEIIFYCVPISSFESVIKTHKKYFKHNHVLIDVLSVKMFPLFVLNKYLKNTKTQVLLAHPMFGPDSAKNGFEGLPMILDRFMTSADTYSFWKKYFESKKLNVIEMSALEHDRIAANSQGLTHFIGRLLEEVNFSPTLIDSLGAKKLYEVKDQTCNDTWQLFSDLQQYNPFTKQMRLKLGQAYDKLYNRLLPKQAHPKFVTFGIQGGKGSFNDEAIQRYIQKHAIKKYKIKFLYTSEKVLRNLHEGTIDFGLFATHNAVGGIVTESVIAMAKYTFKIIEEQEIVIRHFLMKRKNVLLNDITSIHAHSQNLKQCRGSLAQKYPNLKQESGSGDLIDTARAAQFLAEGKLSKTTAILGPRTLSDMYDFEIIDSDLQDLEHNVTSFLLVSR